MGLREILTGKKALAKPAADRLFAISTAYVTLQTGLATTSIGRAAIVFQSLATADFQAILADTEDVVRATAADSATSVRTSQDAYGFSWLILNGDGFDDLVVGINAVSTALEAGGYGERLLCAVFAFRAADSSTLNFIYNYKRGSWYPFVPAPGDKQRSTERELQLKAQIGSELPIEPELERWFPLWGVPF